MTRLAAGNRPALLSLCVVCLSVGCRSDMYDQNRYDPLEASTLFDDGTSARPLPRGSVARGLARTDTALYEGREGQTEVETIPIPIDRAMLERGRQRYSIFCAPCHSETGDGDGMIVQRGFSRPPSFHDERLRGEPAGHYFEVITRGHGAMYSYASRIPPRDRWNIVAYIRALQLSQHAEYSRLEDGDRTRLEEARP